MQCFYNFEKVQTLIPLSLLSYDISSILCNPELQTIQIKHFFLFGWKIDNSNIHVLEILETPKRMKYKNMVTNLCTNCSFKDEVKNKW